MLLAVFNNGSILVFDLRRHIQIQDLKAPYNSMIDDIPYNINVCIDEYCSIMSYLSSNQKEINLLSFNWDYGCEKVHKTSMLS